MPLSDAEKPEERKTRALALRCSALFSSLSIILSTATSCFAFALATARIARCTEPTGMPVPAAMVRTGSSALGGRRHAAGPAQLAKFGQKRSRAPSHQRKFNHDLANLPVPGNKAESCRDRFGHAILCSPIGPDAIESDSVRIGGGALCRARGCLGTEPRKSARGRKAAHVLDGGASSLRAARQTSSARERRASACWLPST